MSRQGERGPPNAAESSKNGKRNLEMGLPMVISIINILSCSLQLVFGQRFSVGSFVTRRRGELSCFSDWVLYCCRGNGKVVVVGSKQEVWRFWVVCMGWGKLWVELI
ncbi:hypothetical protein CEXT_645691 [Caerostris extrusa]|uniref:Uncharacterized protein n=1 Tax=Caerostris extrusa TaxID=172846 RepID=A0AAV4Y9Q6_CAEEX|nr:hypothetical protein CEXT_645691 [Caerostris extrusa]